MPSDKDYDKERSKSKKYKSGFQENVLYEDLEKSKSRSKDKKRENKESYEEHEYKKEEKSKTNRKDNSEKRRDSSISGSSKKKETILSDSDDYSKNKKNHRERDVSNQKYDENDVDTRSKKKDKNHSKNQNYDEDDIKIEKERKKKTHDDNKYENEQHRKSKSEKSHSNRKKDQYYENDSEIDEEPKKKENQKNSEAYEDDFDDFESDEKESEIDIGKNKKSTKDYSSEEEYKKKSSHKNKASHKSDYKNDDDLDGYSNGRIVKANAHVSLPTESVIVSSSKIYFNHDSLDRQRRRANDLFKTIELDKKRFDILDINPSEMRTVYSSHLKHQKVQTNDDILDIECQTDEIQNVTRWTQFPSEDTKGYGTENQKYDFDNESDLLQKYKAEININDLQLFLNKSSKVIESLLQEMSILDSNKQSNISKSDIEFSQGFIKFVIPKLLSKLTKSAVLKNCCFCKDDSNYFVCSYYIQTVTGKENIFDSTLLIVWNINDFETPFKILICESLSTCLCYFSFLIISGNVDGSIALWDLRESYSLHKFNLRNKLKSDSLVIRSPTYTTAGILLNENHLSEVKDIIMLQNQLKENDKKIFMQFATLELDCKLIIWTIVELNNIDLNVFETDLGLLPGGKIKLVKSSQIPLNNLIRTSIGKIPYQTLCMTSSTSQINDFFISTNAGKIIHISRKGESYSSSFLSSDISDDMLCVSCVAFHHELEDIMLAGYGNGEIRLYHKDYITPIKSWIFGFMSKIKEIKWITTRSSSFLVIDESDTIFIWDLLLDDSQPVISKQINNVENISMSNNNINLSNQNKDRSQSKNAPFGMFYKNSKEIEIHFLTSELSDRNEKENKKFLKLIKNFMNTF